MPKQPPASLKALGRRPLPERIEVLGRVCRLRQVFKHDFFAATALYESDSGRVLLKVNREAPFMGLPLSWIGRLLAAKERSALQALADVRGIPRYLAPWGRTGIIREFIEGRPLAKGEVVPDDFHAQLRELVAKLHARGIAYVDLEKCENVLVGLDGRPYLFDFQIAWHLPRRLGGELWPARWIRRILQNGDCYHLLKLQRRTRPDQLSPEELAASYRKPWYVRFYTKLVRPLTLVRRMVLGYLDPRNKHGERGRVNLDGPSDAPWSRGA